MLVGHWFESPLGAAVLAAEQALVRPLLDRLFGYHILQIGCNVDYLLIEHSPMSHKLVFAASWYPGLRYPVADNEQLPLATDSMDVVVIHHGLDFTGDSHRLLREATRVLRPGGQMLILGFNPLSLWGVYRVFKRRTAVPWQGRFIARRRLSDWLQLLNLRIEEIHHGLHFPPLTLASVLRQANSLERFGHRTGSPFGGVYVYRCVKQVVPITPVVPRWHPLRTPAAVIQAAENARLRLH